MKDIIRRTIFLCVGIFIAGILNSCTKNPGIKQKQIKENGVKVTIDSVRVIRETTEEYKA